MAYMHGHNPSDALFTVSKRVNDGQWMHYSGGIKSRDAALALIERGKALHAERCPKDRVEFSLTRVY